MPIDATSRPEENDFPSPRQITARTSGRCRSSRRISNNARSIVVVERIVLVGVVVRDRGDRSVERELQLYRSSLLLTRSRSRRARRVGKPAKREAPRRARRRTPRSPGTRAPARTGTVNSVMSSDSSAAVKAQPHRSPTARPTSAADPGDDHRLATHHSPQLPTRHADGPEHADLVRALEHRQRERVDDPENRDELRQEQQRNGDREELVDGALLVAAVLVAGRAPRCWESRRAPRPRPPCARRRPRRRSADGGIRAVVEVGLGEALPEQRVGDHERRPEEEIVLSVDRRRPHIDLDRGGTGAASDRRPPGRTAALRRRTRASRRHRCR